MPRHPAEAAAVVVVVAAVVAAAPVGGCVLETVPCPLVDHCHPMNSEGVDSLAPFNKHQLSHIGYIHTCMHMRPVQRLPLFLITSIINTFMTPQPLEPNWLKANSLPTYYLIT